MSESEICHRCGRSSQDHYGLNFADGPQVGGVVLVCPTATFQPAQASGPRTENPPHGPTSERVMRHYYGAKK